MKTVFIALRAATFGTGFIYLWGWVALSVHHRYDSTLGIALSDWTRVLGVAVLAACARNTPEFLFRSMDQQTICILAAYGAKLALDRIACRGAEETDATWL
jgi:hypothetical protein